MEESELTSFISRLDAVTKKPEKYLSVQDNEAEKIRLLIKDLYGFTKANEFPVKQTEALNELVIDNLDEEQIWQQIELQNTAVLDGLVSSVAHLLAKKNNLKFPLDEKKNKKIKKNETGLEKEHDNHSDVPSNEESDGLEHKQVKKPSRGNVKPIKPSIVDDKFFKLSEMEEFLEKMEKTTENRKVKDGADSDDEDIDEDIDFFMDCSSSSDQDADDQPKYGDFFDEPYDEINHVNLKRQLDVDNVVKENKKKKVKFSDEKDSKESGEDRDEDDKDIDDDDLFDAIRDYKEVGYEEDNESDDDNGNVNFNELDDRGSKEDLRTGDKQHKNENPSEFEARQERLKLRINKLEETALKEKPWQMKGEITADNRPQNSLLQEYVEFDVATRPAPVITEKTTLRLEDIIKQRIKDKAWDDVVRKIKPVESELEYKKKLVLDQEKSKLSLAQIYEQEYLKQVENKVTENVTDKPEIEPPEHQEIRALMKNLFRKLDALSNFHFTPQPVSAEVKIISNLPAISMEEVAPIAVSDAALLAPEEVKAKQKGELIGKSERTATDKKRERRQKKLRQKLKFKKIEEKARENLENAKSKTTLNKKYSNKLLQKITKSSNVTALEEKGGKYVKSSSAFFSKLQDEESGKLKKKNLELGKKNFSKKTKSKKR